MSQRSIRQSLVLLTVEFGEEGKNGKVILNKKALQAIIRECKKISKIAQHGLKRGGLVVVESAEGTLITTYPLARSEKNV